MKLLPAIDIIDGKCVRLSGGDYNQVTTYSDDPTSVASDWYDKGLRNLHIVDLDGAKTGKLVNLSTISKIRERFPDFYIQVGGGIRDIASIQKYHNIGIDKVIIGTIALSSSNFLASIPEDLRKIVIVDIAIKNDNLTTNGWIENSDYRMEDFFKNLMENQIQEIVVTDVSKDGMLNGVNKELLLNVSSKISIPIIASGGVSSIGDIKLIQSIASNGINGLIIGKALYENRVAIDDIIDMSSK
mgnify:FL=1|tara:strand:+ start:744 stop:1472 length:729 start_codon:yes stop_codon:yes gene_type:complete